MTRRPATKPRCVVPLAGLLFALPSCEAVVAVTESAGVSESGEVHEQGLALRWHGLDVWSDGSTVQFSGQVQVSPDQPGAQYVIVLQVGAWRHALCSGIGNSPLQAIDGSVTLPDPAVLAERPCPVALAGHLDTVPGALEGRSNCFRAALGTLRRTDPLPPAK